MDINEDQKSEFESREKYVDVFVKDISNASVNKQKYVEGLKYDYEKEKLEVQHKMEELKRIKESNATLQNYLNSHKYMTNELLKSEEADIKDIEVNRETAQVLRDEIAKLKQVRNEDLAAYEEKVANMTNKFIKAPFDCDSSLLSGNMEKLLQIQKKVKEELLTIKCDLDMVMGKKFCLEETPANSRGDSKLNTLLKLSEPDEEQAKLMSETEKLNAEVQAFEKISSSMQRDIKTLKQQHKIEK